MRQAFLWLLVALIAAPATGDQSPNPDYSREALLRMFAPPPPHKLPPGRFQFHLGYMEWRALGMQWRFFYLPFAAPLPGTRLKDTATLPNAFDLTGTRYASTMPPMFTSDRSWAVERELRRIERLTKKQRVRVAH